MEGLGYTGIDNQAQFTNSLAFGGLALELHRQISSHYGRLERLEHVVSTKTKIQPFGVLSYMSQRLLYRNGLYTIRAQLVHSSNNNLHRFLAAKTEKTYIYHIYLLTE